MRNLKLDTSDKLKEFLHGIVSESVADAKNFVFNKEKRLQQVFSGGKHPDSEFLEEADDEDNVEEKPDFDKLNSDMKEKEAKASKELSPQTVFNAINQIRSGKSLKNMEIRTELTKYFDALSKPQQVALTEFLVGLGDIIVRGESAEEAEEPSDEVKMTAKVPEAEEDVAKAETEQDKVQIKKLEKEAGEDTSPPITVKK